jgi:hypothetical protein
MKKSKSIALCVLAALLAIAPTTGRTSQATATPRLRLLVPAYFYPSGDGLKEWDRLLAGRGLELTTVIINPASGPGERQDSNYARLLERLGKTKATAIGYVTTSYAKRPIAEVKSDVDKWLELYPGIQGIFFDEQASGLPPLGYYRELYRYVRTQKRLALVVGNPGVACDEDYLSLPCSDTTCLFEGPWPPGGLGLPSWTSRYPASRTSVLPYAVSTPDQMREIVRIAVRKRVGVIYVTDTTDESRWNRLPSYWEEEVRAVQEAIARP